MAALRERGAPSPAGGRHDQHGSGTVLAAGTVVLLMAVAAAILVVGAYLVAADHARGAADLVAISAAATVAQRGDGCRAAADIARRNGVSLAHCTVRGDSLDFVVSVTVRQSVRLRLPLLPDAVPVTSHAGRLGVIARG
jgi:secretion/DNA translocation related TadE-like protein